MDLVDEKDVCGPMPAWRVLASRTRGWMVCRPEEGQVRHFGVGPPDPKRKCAIGRKIGSKHAGSATQF